MKRKCILCKKILIVPAWKICRECDTLKELSIKHRIPKLQSYAPVEEVLINRIDVNALNHRTSKLRCLTRRSGGTCGNNAVEGSSAYCQVCLDYRKKELERHSNRESYVAYLERNGKK